jgi:hypothetical protein
MSLILQKTLPHDPFARPPLPGITPLGDQPWLIRDEAFDGQMALRDRLIAERRDDVIRLDPAARDAALELLEEVEAEFTVDAREGCLRADGASVALDRGDPLATLGRLAQEDFCILEKRGDEHVLVGAVLCFPAGWTLAEKFQRPLGRIHRPVRSYDDEIARRVQRLFDGVRPGRPLLRYNALWYSDPALHQPRSESVPHPAVRTGETRYFRSERQVIRRLPRTGAVVFSIHTFVLRREDVADAAQGRKVEAR